MRIQKKAFTLIELLIVIAILALLTSLAFAVYTSYLRNTRDGIRLSHLETIGKSLNVYVIEESLYPSPSTATEVSYSGVTIWKQGELADDIKEIISTSGKLSASIKDPTTGENYAYSVTDSRREYQIAAIREGSSVNRIPLINTANAAGNTIGYAVVKGNFNRKIIGAFSGSVNTVIAIPSIIVNDLSSNDIEIIVANKRFVYDKHNNLPANFTLGGYNLNGGFDFIPNNLVVYTGSLRNLQTKESSRINLLKNIQDTYVGTPLEGSLDNIGSVTIDTSSPSDEAKELAIFIVEKILNKPVSGKKVFVQKTLKNTSWEDISSNPINLFETGSIFTENWESNACDTDSMSLVELNPGTSTIPLNLAPNTVYRLQNGAYTSTGTIEMDDCSALIGYGKAILYSTAYLADGNIQLNNKNNVIIHGLEINGYDDGNGGTHQENFFGIDINTSAYLTLNKLAVYKTKDGVELHDSSSGTLNNIKSYSNKDDGINFQGASQGNTINNIQVYDNGDDGFGIYQASSDNNTINNVQSYNNRDEGIIIGFGTNNHLSNIFSYKNGDDGLNLDNSTNTIINNYYGFANGGNGLDLSSQSNTLYGTIQLFGNGGSAITSGDTYGSDDYLGFDDGFKLTTGTFGTSWVTIPSITGWDYTELGDQTWVGGSTIDKDSIDGDVTYTYGSNVIYQDKLVKYFSSAFELYGTNWIHYIDTKRIGEY